MEAKDLGNLGKIKEVDGVVETPSIFNSNKVKNIENIKGLITLIEPIPLEELENNDSEFNQTIKQVPRYETMDKFSSYDIDHHRTPYHMILSTNQIMDNMIQTFGQYVIDNPSYRNKKWFDQAISDQMSSYQNQLECFLNNLYTQILFDTTEKLYVYLFKNTSVSYHSAISELNKDYRMNSVSFYGFIYSLLQEEKEDTTKQVYLQFLIEKKSNELTVDLYNTTFRCFYNVYNHYGECNIYEWTNKISGAYEIFSHFHDAMVDAMLYTIQLYYQFYHNTYSAITQYLDACGDGKYYNCYMDGEEYF